MEEKKLKWVMISNYIHKSLLENEDCLRTGLYSWIAAFDGEVRLFKDMEKEDFKKYDIIQVNLAGQDVHLLGEIREILDETGATDTKLIANNDYTVELWQSSFDHLSTLKREINHADMIFGTEPNQVNTMEILLERKVHLITHPCFTRRLKTLRPKKSLNMISVVSHRYDNYNSIPSLAVDKLGYKTRLIGYDSNTDKFKFSTTTRYNKILEASNYFDFCEQLMESKIVVDPFTLTSQSRVGWDCAALGVPLVGSDRNYSVMKCFPRTAVPPFDIKAMREMSKRLLNDDKFRQEVIDYAKEAVEYVSYENSVKKYKTALKIGSPKVNI